MSIRAKTRKRRRAEEAERKRQQAWANHLAYHANLKLLTERDNMPLPPHLIGQVPDSVKYRQLIMQTLAQLNNTNAMIQSVKEQANEAGAAGDMTKVAEQERLVMHLDNKTVNLLSIIATYEVAFQTAVANERAAHAQAEASRIKLI